MTNDPPGQHRRRQHHPNHAPPTRIKSFLRRYRHDPLRRILVPPLIASAVVLYLRGLLRRDVGSGYHALLDRGIILRGNSTTAPARHYSVPLWAGGAVPGGGGSTTEPRPRSLADVVIANAEISWKVRLDRENAERARAERARERRRRREEEEASLLRGGTGDGTSGVGAGGRRPHDPDEDRPEDDAAASEEAAPLSPPKDDPTSSSFRGEEGGGEGRPPSGGRGGGPSTPNTAGDHPPPANPPRGWGRRAGVVRGAASTPVGGNRDGKDAGGAFPVLFLVAACAAARVCLDALVARLLGRRHPASSAEGDGEEDVDDDGDDVGRGGEADDGGGGGGGVVGGRLLPSLFGRDAASRLRQRRARVDRGFHRFVDRLNAEREANGERRIGADTLRHLAHGRDFDGNDYDRLYSFVEENGPAMGSFLSAMGATEAEIGRCPTRTVGVHDADLLRPNATCPVCLERYGIGDVVRTIPCFHAFHSSCIDPWLTQRAECPVCKHSAIG